MINNGQSLFLGNFKNAHTTNGFYQRLRNEIVIHCVVGKDLQDICTANKFAAYNSRKALSVLWCHIVVCEYFISFEFHSQ